MSKHTPGPWVVVRRRDHGDHVIQSDSDTVAVVWDEGGSPDADARLIAAAPDMLAALELLLANVLAGDEGGYSKREHAAAIAAAEGAIAKARGA